MEQHGKKRKLVDVEVTGNVTIMTKDLVFGEIFKSARVARGLTMAWIADRAGRNQSYLSHIERGRSAPREEFLRTVAPHYGCPWWSPRHNVTWWITVAQLGGVLPARLRGRQSARIEADFNAARRTLATLEDAVTQDASVRTLFDELGDHLYLPGVRKVTIPDTLPVWAWIHGTFEQDIYAMHEGPSAVETAGALITYVGLMLRDVAVDVDATVVGRRVQQLREARGWSAESLTRQINQLPEAADHALIAILETADVVDIEQGLAPISLAVVELMARAFNVPPSRLLAAPAADSAVNEDEICDLLREYGLSDEAVASIRGLIAYWHARELDSP